MTASPRSGKITDEILGESWVELGTNGSSTPPDRITPLPFFTGEEYLRLLKEAQRESNHSSSRVSSASSRRDTPRDSPKSPPNSPNTELNPEDDFKGVYINYLYKDGVVNVDGSSDWIWDWSSRPDQAPPKDWKFKHPKRKTYSIRNAKVGKNGLFSKEVLYTLFLTNVISLLLGTGVGSTNQHSGLFGHAHRNKLGHRHLAAGMCGILEKSLEVAAGTYLTARDLSRMIEKAVLENSGTFLAYRIWLSRKGISLPRINLE